MPLLSQSYIQHTAIKMMAAPEYYVFTGSDGERVPRHVTHILIDRALKFVPARTFQFHENIQVVKCHDGVEKIGEDSFYKCFRLRRVIISEDEQVVVAATPQPPERTSTGTDVSDSDETVPWNSDDETRQQLNLQSLKGEDDESSEDDEDLDEDDAEKSSGENCRVHNVASPPPEAVAKMEVISISSGSPPSDGDDGFIVDETEKATIHEHVDEVYPLMTVQHTQLLVAQRLRIAREDLGVEREDLVKQRMEHLLRENNYDVENEVAGSALENRQGNVPRGVQHDSDAISVYSSSDDDDVSSSTDPTDQQILDLVNVLFQQADPDKVKVTDIQRQVANHFRLGDRMHLEMIGRQ